ncbi:MAG: fimbrillin family protein [Rikenellaceae bacterium]
MIRIFFSLVMLFLLSCSEVESLDVDNAMTPNSPLQIDVSTESITKGEMVYEPEDMGSIGLYCAMTGDEYWSTITRFSKMENQRYYISDSGDWVIDGEVVLWGYESATDRYTFFAYSPHSKDTKGVTPSIVDGELVINYSIPGNSIDQPDLMLAMPRKDIYAQIVGGAVSLDFYHTLSSVSFSIVSTAVEKIVGVEITGVINEGSLSWDYDLNEPQWSLEGVTTDTFSVDIETDYTLDNENSGQLNTERGYLMMIPQELTNGAEVIVTLDSGEQKSLTIPEGSVWEAGKTYNYVIRLDTECDFLFTSDQISNCYIINPTVGKETIIQIPIQERINDFWKNYSGYNTKKIKAANTTDDFTVAMVWEDFDGDTFTFDYTVLYDADGNMAVKFIIPEEFQEGNFIFAVQDDDGTGSKSTLWSWHLWFTDYNPDVIADKNIDNIELGVDKEYTLSGYEGAVHRYKDASSSGGVWSGMYKDKFIMDRNIGERNEPATNYGAGTVYYQFGRKDPFPGNGAIYSTGATQPSARSVSGLNYYVSVEFSDDFFITGSSSSGNWCGETAARFANCIWFDKNVSLTDEVGKSIFDPSPLGWRIPVSDTWSSFDKTGSTQKNYSNTKSVGVYNYYGCRNAVKNNILTDWGDIGYVWSANPIGTETGYCLYTTDEVVTSPFSAFMTYGFPIRAIQE